MSTRPRTPKAQKFTPDDLAPEEIMLPVVVTQEELVEMIAEHLEDIETIPWLSDEDYAKAVGQYRMQFGALLNEMLEPLRLYGMSPFVDSAISAIIDCGVSLAEDFGLRVRGIDKVISLEIIKLKRAQRESLRK